MLPNIHLIGIQGCGKGTQSALLVEKYGLTYLAAGNLFRARAALNDGFAQEIRDLMGGGHLLPDNYLVQTVRDYLSNTIPPVGLLGDGVIRNLTQYEALEPIWPEFGLDAPFVIHYLLDEEVALERIDHRRLEVENSDKREFHSIYSGKLIHRDDDNPLAIHERFRLFHDLTEPLLNMLETNGVSRIVDASRGVEEVFHITCAILEEHYPELAQYVSH